MSAPLFVKIRNHILNLNSIRRAEVDGRIVRIHLPEGDYLELIEDEADAFLGILGTGYMKEIHISDLAKPAAQD
jgi:hypothetical protein